VERLWEGEAVTLGVPEPLGDADALWLLLWESEKLWLAELEGEGTRSQ